MGSIFIFIHIFLTIVFLFVLGMKPTKASFSRFELIRRTKLGDKRAKNELARDQALVDIYSLLTFTRALLLVALALIGLVAYGTVWAIIVISAHIVLSGFISRSWPFRGISRSLYQKFEFRLISICKKYSGFIDLIRIDDIKPAEQRLGSSEDLVQLLDNSEDALTREQMKLILGGLGFPSQLVKDVMVAKSKIVSIKKSEVLGPIVLNDLHRSGHSHFPVINRDIDHVVGILDAGRLLVISGDSRSSSGVETVMDKAVYTINQNENLSEALKLFVEKKCSILIVKNKSDETLGILTLGDIMTKLFGSALTEIETGN